MISTTMSARDSMSSGSSSPQHDAFQCIGHWDNKMVYSTPNKGVTSSPYASHQAPASLCNYSPYSQNGQPTLSINHSNFFNQAHVQQARRNLFCSENSAENSWKNFQYKPNNVNNNISEQSSPIHSDEDPFADLIFSDSMLPFPVQPRRNVFIEPNSGMKDVPSWLKSLRLHKYTTLFQQLSYEQMMALNEYILERQGVTKGARKKILNSIEKLRTRIDTLLDIQNAHRLDAAQVRMYIQELRSMVFTPLRAYPLPGKPEPIQARIDGINVSTEEVDRQNLPAHFTRALGRLHACLQENTAITCLYECNEQWGHLMSIYERVSQHEAFTLAQKRRVGSWKQQARKQWTPLVQQQQPQTTVPTVNLRYALNAYRQNQPLPACVVPTPYPYPLMPIQQPMMVPQSMRTGCDMQQQDEPNCGRFRHQSSEASSSTSNDEWQHIEKLVNSITEDMCIH